MKVQAEISFTLENEPEAFKVIAPTHRVVYIWENKRGHLICDQPWQTFSRRSVMTTPPENGFMEFWSKNINDISDPPNDADDMWDETYKIIEHKNYCMEWHPVSKQLRIVWAQSEETLNDHKIITQVNSEIENLGKGFPNFPTLIPKSKA
jgi:hypothetical protein